MARSGNPNPVKSPETEFAEGNTAAVKHGVKAGIEDLAAGRPLRGDLAVIQRRYDTQLATHEGRIDAQRWLTSGFFAIAQGLLAVIQDAIEHDEKDKAVAYIRHFGTFGSKAGNEIQRLAEMAQGRDDRALDYDELVKELRG